MKNLPRLPSGTAAVIVALVLVAGVVAGREQVAVTAVLPPQKALATPGAQASDDDIDMTRLMRQREKRVIQDLFASAAPAPPPAPPPAPLQPAPAAVVKPEPPPTPSAPPLPYTYLGRLKRGEQTIVYLLKGQEVLIAKSGDAVENLYRVHSVSDNQVQFVYIPLGTPQVLTIPAMP